MITQSQMLPTGMVTSSATNPLDQVPVGPQVFPFGIPSVSQSIAEPYQASNYTTGIKSLEASTATIIPQTTYQTLETIPTYTSQIQTADALNSSALVQYQTVGVPAAVTQVQASEVYPLANISAVQYDLGAQAAALYQTPYITGYQYRTVMKPVVTTAYKSVVNYKPVATTRYVPQTRLVPRIVNSGIQQPTDISTLTQVVPQPLAVSQAPLTTVAETPVTTPIQTLPLSASVPAPLINSMQVPLSTSVEAPLTTSMQVPLSTSVQLPLITSIQAPVTSVSPQVITTQNALL